MNSQSAMQYYLIKVSLVSNPFCYLFFVVDEDTMELFDYEKDDLFWDS